MRSSTGGVGAWIRYGNPLEPGELDFAIAHYRAAILQPWETEAAARLKEARPDMTVLAYRCLSSTRDFEPDSMRASGLSYREARRRGWLARRDNGDLVEWNTYPGHFQARVWDPDYRARWVEEVCQATAETAFDGVMADNDVFDDYYGLDLPLDGIADTAALRAELNIFVDQAGAGLNGVGKILIPNVAEARREPGRWERHSAWGGGFDECWLGWGDHHLFDEATALAQIHELRGPGLSIVRTPDGGGGGSMSGARTSPGLYADLGRPLGRPRRTSGAWVREFEGGVAAVALGEEGGGTVRLPAGLRSPGPTGDPDGEALALEVRLSAHRGMIALRA